MANANSNSVLISAILDSMGFSRHIIDFRINNISHMDVMGVLSTDPVGNMATGGKAEGTSIDGQGDIDIMYVIKYIIVSGHNINPPSPYHAVLSTVDSVVHHGYTWLRVDHLGQVDDVITQTMILTVGPDSKEASYLSSSAFIKYQQHVMKQYLPNWMQFQQVLGPSQPIISNHTQVDTVFAFPHPDWPVQASQWMNRCGTNRWPPETIVTAIVQSGCHIVPKGFNGSPSSHMEWCFSFAVHEKSILQLFNMTQKHLYILLKIIAKDLKERFNDFQDVLTSYTMKTVALWQVELHHTKDWNRLHVLYRLMEALYYLKSCVENENLPAYFIPENNLFDGKLNPRTAALLSGHLNSLLSQGTRCVLKFPSIQVQLQIMQKPGYRICIYCSGWEMFNLICQVCRKYLASNVTMEHIHNILSLINLHNMKRHRFLTQRVLKVMKATLAYVNIARIMNTGMSNRRKYEFCLPLLLVASNNGGIDTMSGKVKLAGVLQVLGQTNKVIETLYSIKLRPPFRVFRKCHHRIIIGQKYSFTKQDSDYTGTTIARLGRDNLIQQCLSLDVRYTKEEMGIVPDVIKYEFFHAPESDGIHSDAYIDPDTLMYYLLYKCHTELGDEENAQSAFNNLIRIAIQESFDPHIEYREVALNVLGLCYLEKEDYLRSYSCFCRGMSLRPRLLAEKWSTSTPWHLAVLVSKLINR
ncbi:hypothetical protein ACJMK2_032668 [Sinanodonta woodiana]|uniref:Mab-21-like HhH/H2TH-like domain-containing protein n=1 Tax=Sinanodonta woodiana TaxID=1069815 RepID=A0ABD3X2M4_SINWO